MALSACHCRFQVCDKWGIYTFTSSVRTQDPARWFASNLHDLLCFLMFFIPCRFLCWLSFVSVGCSCLLLGVEYRLSSADCRLSGVGSWLLIVCVGCCSVFPLSVPTSSAKSLSALSIRGIQFYSFWRNSMRFKRRMIAISKKNQFLLYTKCLKMYRFMSICLQNL